MAGYLHPNQTIPLPHALSLPKVWHMRVRRWVRWVGMISAVVLLSPIAVALALYIPLIQDATVRWTSAWLTQRTGTPIGVERMRLIYPLQVQLEGVRVGTLLDIKGVEANIQMRPLLRGVIAADYVSARGIAMHADTTAGRVGPDIWAERLRVDDIAYHWDERNVNIQRIVLGDGHVAVRRGTTPPPKVTKDNRLPLSLSIAEMRLLHIGTNYTQSSTQVEGFVDEIALHDVKVDTALHIALRKAELRNGKAILRGALQDTAPMQLTQLNAQVDSLRYSTTSFAVQLTQLAFEESHGIALREGTMALTWHEGVLRIPHLALRTEHSTLQGRLHTLGYSARGVTIDGDADLHIGYADMRNLAEWAGGFERKFISLYPAETLNISIAADGTMEQLQLTRCAISLPTAFDIDMNGTVQDIATPRQCKVKAHMEAHTYDLDLLTPLMEKKGIRIPSDITCQGDIDYAPDTLYAQCALTLKEGTAFVEAGYRLSSGAYKLRLETNSLDLQQIVPEGEWGMVTLQAHLAGCGVNDQHEATIAHAALQLHTLQWKGRSYSNTSAQASLDHGTLRAHVTCDDSLMQWSMATIIMNTPNIVRAQVDAQVGHLDMQALQLANTNIRPALRCQATLAIDSGATYALHARFTDIVLSNGTQRMQPRPLDLHARLTADTAQLNIRSGDLALTTSAHIEGLPWQQELPLDLQGSNRPSYLSALQATLSAGDDNPVSNYLALMGITFRTLHATLHEQRDTITGHLLLDGITAKGFSTDTLSLNARYSRGILHAHLKSNLLTWSTPQMLLQGRADAAIAWGGSFDADSLRGMLHLSSLQYSLPTYSLHLYTGDTLHIPLERGGFTFTAIPLYTTDRKSLLLDGRLVLLGRQPSAQLHLTARDTPLLQSTPTRKASLYGKALVSGNVTLKGPLNALSITGGLSLRPGSSIHYIYKDAILTASNQLDNVVTFVSLGADTTTLSKGKLTTNNLSINLTIAIAPTARLEASLGASKQNDVTLQGGGILNLQYIPATGLRLSGSYAIETGELNMNVPLLHVSHMAIRQGSTVTWSGNPQNPQLNITAEERIRASVTLDGSPQSIAFIAGMSFTNTMDKLSVQFTLSAPENASMQNTLTTLSAEERGKLAVALLTTGLYLGEGGTGNLMNTALMNILQSQIDNISRDAFRTVDVSVGIEPIPDGVSGVSTRTDYSFSIAKRLWDNRIRIVIGGSVTTNNERIEENAVIDNISIEWRINPVGNQYLRFFYDKNFESILEGEIREIGVGYAYRRRF